MTWEPRAVLIIHIKGYSALSTDKEKVFHELLLPQALRDLGDYKAIGTWRFHRMSVLCVGPDLTKLCQAALDLRDITRKLSWEKYLGKPLDIRISVHVGEAPTHEDLFGPGRLVIGASIADVDQFPQAPENGVWITSDVVRRLSGDTPETTPSLPGMALDDFGDMDMLADGLSCHLYYLRRPDEPAQIRPEGAPLSLREQFANSLTSPTMSRGLDKVTGIVVADDKVLMVMREPKEGLSEWYFPSVEFFPEEDCHLKIAQEIRLTAGIRCQPERDICHRETDGTTDRQFWYCGLTPVDSRSIRNVDPRLNKAIAWVEIPTALHRLEGRASPSVLGFLTDFLSDHAD